ncbi:hypothetical protein [Staphylococcus pseudintermedius]|uniref:TraG/VirB4 family ATPase n=1 Tax=Staphylococcus pseudintermedius TaxID=283734 RepID=UPI00399A028E
MVEEQLAVAEDNATNQRLGKASMKRAEDRIEELQSFLDNINDESENLTRTTILLFVKASSEEELYDAEVKLDNLLKESKFRGQRLRFLPNNTYYIQKPVFDIILQELWEEIKKDRNERVGLYVDEAWYLSDEKHQQTMEFLRNIAKRIRKYGGYCVTITQEVDDFVSTGKYGKSIIKNAFVKTLFQLTEDDIMQLEKFMVLSKAEKDRILRGTKKGEAVQIVGKKKIMLDVDYTEYETEILHLTVSQEVDSEEYLQTI